MAKNLTTQRDAIARIVAMMSKWNVTLQDIVDEYNRIVRGYKNETKQKEKR